MSEIYWITRLDYIQGCLFTFLFFVGAMSAIAAVWVFLYDEESKTVGTKRLLKWTIPSFIIAMLTLCFVPSTKEAMLIYGLGGTIDYIKFNDKAKQLPDKCINALTRYVDSIEKENKKADTNNKLRTI